VGPGICRKWRPTEREEFFDIGKSLRIRNNESLADGGSARRDLPP
jgi:hypothetical protein